MTKPTPLHQTLIHMLPYGLKIMRPDGKTVLEMIGIIKNTMVFQENLGRTYGDATKAKPVLRPLSDLDNDQLDKIGNIINGGGAIREFNIEDAQAWIKGSMKPLMNLKQNIEIIQYFHSIFANIYDVPEGQFIPVTKTFNPYK